MGKKILGLDISSGDPSRGGRLEVGDYVCPSCASSVSFSLPEYCGQFWLWMFTQYSFVLYVISSMWNVQMLTIISSKIEASVLSCLK